MKLEDFKPGTWIRSKQEPHAGRAFVLFVKDGAVSYHLERPYCPHPRLGMGWMTGGTLFPSAFEYWEPDESSDGPDGDSVAVAGENFADSIRSLISPGQFDLRDSPKSLVSNITRLLLEYDQRLESCRATGEKA